jgi:phosphatidylinositol kinase/protein kinase (PI-3  family)
MSNILVHVRTGEVIHIDFGIVFELGKVRGELFDACSAFLLSRSQSPSSTATESSGNSAVQIDKVRKETVCWLFCILLSSSHLVAYARNVIDGMGPLGVEGSFTAAAEATLEVLKRNADGLLTILSAVVSDPLYEWRIGSKQPRREEEGEEFRSNEMADSGNVNESVNEVAKHAITRIHEKLLGYEDGTLGEQQSVKSQVQLLINAARDADNLCLMFPGWAPWQ